MMRVCYHCFHNIQEERACPYCGYNPADDAGKYPFALRPGTILANRYVLGRVLGQGGFGITYVAYDYQTRSRIAIKEYLPSEIATRIQNSNMLQVYSANMFQDFEDGKRQFLEEARTLGEFVGNDHIVGIQSYFEENNTAYFAMEYLEGITLKNLLLERQEPISVSEADQILLPIMEVLDWIHSKGIIHRDIAPDNIMLRKDGVAKLIDFGAARISTTEKSRSLDVILKHGFAPMEQYTRRGRQGPFTDVYAMAATYYYSITGRVPPDAIERSDEDELVPPSKLGIEIRPETETVLMKALAVPSTERYQTMAEFYQRMLQAEMGNTQTVSGYDVFHTVSGEKGTNGKKKSKRYGFFAAAAVLLLVLSALFINQSGFLKKNPAISPEEMQRIEEENARIAAEEEAARIALEERIAKEEASMKAAEEKAAQEEANRKAAEEQAAQEEANRKAAEEKAAQEEASRKAAEEKAAQEEANRKAAEEKAAQEEANRKAAEEKAAQEALAGKEAEEEHEIDLKPKTAQGITLVEGDFDIPGSIIRFGQYEQDNDLNNGTEDIEWIIMESKEDGLSKQLHLVSRYGLDVIPYNFGGDSWSVIWETCTLRTWLNEEFIEAAFVPDDQDAIMTMEADNGTRQGYFHTAAHKNTVDRVCLLSYAESLFFSDTDRGCLVSRFAAAQGAYVNKDTKQGSWWLRSPGEDNGTASFVLPEGDIESIDVDYVDYGITIRPSIWIDMSLVTVNEPAEDPYAGAFARIGSTVEFGSYEQDNVPENGKEAIEWIVLDMDGDRRLLLSKQGLDRREFHSYSAQIQWEDSEMRKWLNHEFMDEAFDVQQQKGIRFTLLDNNKNQWYNKIYDGNKSMDKVFLLSYAEVMKYLPANEDRVCENTPFAVAKRAGRTQKWWLRSPGKVMQFADYIDSNGKRGDETMTNKENFVRPAIWVEVSTLQGKPLPENVYPADDFKEIGNLVYFGHYEQDNREETGKEDIEWVVVDVDNRRVTLVSRYALDKQKFHNVSQGITWNSSDLYEWLNNDFKMEAFSPEEQDAMRSEVALLSNSDANSYFRTAYERTCCGTAYINDGLRKDIHDWWLSSRGKVDHYYRFVDEVGGYSEAWVCDEHLVRPMITVDLSDKLFMKAA